MGATTNLMEDLKSIFIAPDPKGCKMDFKTAMMTIFQLPLGFGGKRKMIISTKIAVEPRNVCSKSLILPGNRVKMSLTIN